MSAGPLRRLLPWVPLFVVAGIAVAQSGAGRDIPYVGSLDENGLPVTGQRALRVELFVSEAALAPCDTHDFANVEVNAGTFAVELADVPDGCFTSGELYLELSVGQDLGALTALTSSSGGRQRVGTVPFAAAGPFDSTAFFDGDLVVNGAAELSASGDGVSILLLGVDQPWQFEQDGVGAGSDLVLRNLAGTGASLVVETPASFVVRNTSGVTAFTASAAGSVSTANVTASGTMSAGTYGPACTTGMTRVGSWCIDNVFTNDAAAVTSESGDVFDTRTFNEAARFCHSEGKVVCPLEAIQTCDVVEPAGADCTVETDSAAGIQEVWTSTPYLPGTVAHDLFNAMTVFNGDGNIVSYVAYDDTGNEFWCCRPARY